MRRIPPVSATAMLLFWGPGLLFQRRFSGTGKDFALRLKARAVAGTIPRFVRVVPTHDAFHVRAYGRHQMNPAILGAVSGCLAAAQAQNFSFANLEIVH